jgi:ABC-type proline/glycine betaine transport system ATPase subunit
MDAPAIGLQLKGVGKAFGSVRVVRALDLEIRKGEFVVLLGASGCGKSTTLRMVAGLEEVTEGRILIGGRDVTHAHPMARDIAMVFQNYALYPHMDVAQNMSFALRLAAGPRPRSQAKVKAAAKVLNIEHLLERKPKELSGGPAPARGHRPLPSCASRRSSCSTSRCPTSTPSCAGTCAPSWRCCTSAWARPRSTSRTTRSRR